MIDEGWYAETREPEPPRRLGDVLGEVVRKLGLPDPTALDALARAWPTLAGAAIGAHSAPRSLRDGVLTIAVDSPAWATQLRYLEVELVNRAAAHAPVTSLRVVVDAGC
ncbi:MAG: DUF721 domain-containing protein [Actinobacteria bacterium]|nr:DUF721 domain-containing protein [Actinomycetota bacterium]